MPLASKVKSVKKYVQRVHSVRIVRKSADAKTVRLVIQRRDNVFVQLGGKVIVAIARAMQILGEKIVRNAAIVLMMVLAIHKPASAPVVRDGLVMLAKSNVDSDDSDITVPSNAIVISIIQFLVIPSMVDANANRRGLVSLNPCYRMQDNCL